MSDSYPCRVRRLFCCSLALSGICVFLSGVVSRAATISWSGAGGDNLWSNPTNWTGGLLPTSNDDVVINMPGDTTIRMNVPSTSVRSLQCAESFLLEAGPFRVTAGASAINGAFSVPTVHPLNQFDLQADGVGTLLALNGTVTNVGGLTAVSGAVITAPNARDLVVKGFHNSFSFLSAIGSGSAVLMTNLTNVVILGLNTFRVNASGGGHIDLRRMQVPVGPMWVSAENAGSVVDLSGMNGMWEGNYEPAALYAADGGTVLIPNVTGFDRADVRLSGTANVPLGQIRSFTHGSLTLTSRTNGLEALATFSGALYAVNSRLDLTNFTRIQYTNDWGLIFESYQGSVINLSRVTNVVAMGFSSGLSLVAGTGGRIDLHGLRTPVPPMTVIVNDPGSEVDLSGFNGEWAGNGSAVSADHGGSIMFSNVTTLRGVNLDLRHDAIVTTSQLRSFTEGSIVLYGRTNGFERLTNFTGAIAGNENTRLDLTNFTVFHLTNENASFVADQGSFIDLSSITNVVTSPGRLLSASAYNGGRIDLSGLRTAHGVVQVNASGADTLVDLSGLIGLWRDGSLSAREDATVLIPAVTALVNGSLVVDHTPHVNLDQLTSITDTVVTLTSITNDLAGLTNFSGSISASDVSLKLTNLVVLYATNQSLVFIVGPDSVIDMSNVTNVVINPGLQVELNAIGGRIDLRQASVPHGTVQVIASGANSLVDLSGLTGLWTPGPGQNNSAIQAGAGASVRIDNVTAMRGIDIELHDDALVPIAQLRSYTAASFGIYNQTEVFPALTNFDGTLRCYSGGRAEFPALTQLSIADSSLWLEAADGGVVDLTQVTNRVAGSGNSMTLSARDGGQIYLPHMQGIAADCVDVGADGADAVVDLSGLTGLFSDYNCGSLLTANGGIILLNTNGMLLAGMAINLQTDTNELLPPFDAPAQSLVIYGQPWRSYRVEMRDPGAAGSPWTPYARVPLTTPLRDLGPRPPPNAQLRVNVIVADPPEIDIRLASADEVELIVFGVPGRTYHLESRTNVAAGTWEAGPMQIMTNSFSILPATGATNAARFYRVRE